MSAILRSLKSDLLDRRLLPILLALGLALVGAIAYAVLAGGGSSPKPVAAVAPAPTPVSQGPSLAVSQAPANPNAAIAETTNGARFQHRAGSHNPFTPLASPAAKTSSTAKSATASPSGSSSSSSESKSGSSTSTGGSPTTPSTPSRPLAPKPKPKPKPVYVVAVQFGLLSSTPGALAQLTSYPDLKPRQQLPSAQDARIVFAGARGDGKSAVFALGREAILKGQAICVPSASQCEAIELEAGQSEELDYLEPDGQSVPYELKIVSIAKQEAAAARTARRHRHRRG